ncbi:hypothetical protein Glove_266g4 [Diversispora epigaea]|uniref:Uncharacterized protein n=1 Tax=Diversispora epigaea TaxID=1348612 RepID=A0A397I995_9GLOM|nr:hypothetical protein Glove_266g4 [Diversispora epigaea]
MRKHQESNVANKNYFEQIKDQDDVNGKDLINADEKKSSIYECSTRKSAEEIRCYTSNYGGATDEQEGKRITGRMNKNRNPIDGANMHKSDILFSSIYECSTRKSAEEIRCYTTNGKSRDGLCFRRPPYLLGLTIEEVGPFSPAALCPLPDRRRRRRTVQQQQQLTIRVNWSGLTPRQSENSTEARVANLYASLPSMSINCLPVLLRESAFRL